MFGQRSFEARVWIHSTMSSFFCWLFISATDTHIKLISVDSLLRQSVPFIATDGFRMVRGNFESRIQSAYLRQALSMSQSKRLLRGSDSIFALLLFQQTFLFLVYFSESEPEWTKLICLRPFKNKKRCVYHVPSHFCKRRAFLQSLYRSHLFPEQTLRLWVTIFSNEALRHIFQILKGIWRRFLTALISIDQTVAGGLSWSFGDYESSDNDSSETESFTYAVKAEILWVISIFRFWSIQFFCLIW